MLPELCLCATVPCRMCSRVMYLLHYKRLSEVRNHAGFHSITGAWNTQQSGHMGLPMQEMDHQSGLVLYLMVYVVV